MIPKSFRLNLLKTTLHGPVKRGPFYLIVTQPSLQPQFGVKVGKKIDNRSVVRNRFRRQILQWLYRHKNDTISISVLVIFKRKPAAEEMCVLYDNLDQILSNS